MNPKTCFIVVLSVAVGTLIGFKLRSMVQPPMMVAASPVNSADELSHNRVYYGTLSVMAYVNLLKGFRSGEQKLMIDRLESFLDMATMDLASNYSPTWDPYGTSAKQLQSAKAYRTANPYPNSLTNIVLMIDDALKR